MTREGTKMEKYKALAIVHTIPGLNIIYICSKKKKNKIDAYHHAHAKWSVLVRIFEDVPSISL